MRDLVLKEGKLWRFDPVTVDGVVHRISARMSVRVVARKLDDGGYEVWLRSAHFGRSAEKSTDKSARNSESPRNPLRRPKYPYGLAAESVEGTVFVIALVGVDGAAQKTFVEQVNVRVVAREQIMEAIRDRFEKEALLAAKHWKFDPPTASDLEGRSYALVRVPVSFRLSTTAPTEYGQWESYVPGPRKQAPWLGVDEARSDSDAMMAGQIYPVGQSLRLLTPLQSG